MAAHFIHLPAGCLKPREKRGGGTASLSPPPQAAVASVKRSSNRRWYSGMGLPDLIDTAGGEEGWVGGGFQTRPTADARQKKPTPHGVGKRNAREL